MQLAIIYSPTAICQLPTYKISSEQSYRDTRIPAVYYYEKPLIIYSDR